MEIRPFTPEEAVIAASWRYQGVLAIYDGDPSAWQTFLVLSESGHKYYAIVDEGELVGFCCFGPEGRVAGQPAEDQGLLDVGGGIRPDLVGQGLGAVGLPELLAFGRQRFSPPGFRTAIASFNRRSIVLCRWIGFRPTTTFPWSRWPGVHRARARRKREQDRSCPHECLTGQWNGSEWS